MDPKHRLRPSIRGKGYIPSSDVNGLAVAIDDGRCDGTITGNSGSGAFRSAVTVVILGGRS